MNTEQLIPISELSLRLGVETSFILTLEEHGLIKTVTTEQNLFIDVLELPQLEKMVRLHEELEINIEGIQAISHMLERIDDMQTEIADLQNRLRLYE
jgi:DNA-binding transcriptional MerR regulator